MLRAVFEGALDAMILADDLVRYGMRTCSLESLVCARDAAWANAR